MSAMSVRTISPVDDVAVPSLPLPAADVDSSYAIILLVLVVGGRRMGGVSLITPPARLDRCHGKRRGGIDDYVASVHASSGGCAVGHPTV